jgi:lauroyl/myristoyl acyltransferase
MKNNFLSLLIIFWKLSISIPRKYQNKLSYLVSLIFNIFLKKRSAISKKNIEVCFKGLEEHKKQQLIKENIAQSGSVMFDTGVAWFWSNSRINKEIDYCINGLAELKKEQESGYGVLLFFKHSLHLELDARLLGMSIDVYGVERNHNSDFFDVIQKDGRLKGVKGLCNKNNPFKFIKWLKSGKTVLYATDQDYGLQGAEIIEFFGQPAATLSAPYKIIKKTDCKTYYLDSYIKNGKYIIDLKKLNLDMASSFKMSTDLNKIFEKSIREYPSEYLWQHRRFKSTLGKENFYK